MSAYCINKHTHALIVIIIKYLYIGIYIYKVKLLVRVLPMAWPLCAVTVVMVFVGNEVDAVLQHRVALVTKQDLGSDEDDQGAGWVGRGGQLNGLSDGALLDCIYVHRDCCGELALWAALQCRGLRNVRYSNVYVVLGLECCDVGTCLQQEGGRGK